MSSGPDSRILVTGASGFVGSRLLRRLSTTPAEVLGLAPPHGGGAGFAAVDLFDRNALSDLVADFRPTAVVHLAAISSVGDRSTRADSVWGVNFEGTCRLYEAVRTSAEPVRFIFASSAEAYGRQFNRGPLDEESPLEPLSSYARTKAASEYYLRDMATEEFPVVALRLFNHTGAGQDERFVLPSFAAQFARAIKSGGETITVGNLDSVRDFSDVSDVLEAYVAVLESDYRGKTFEVYNVGSGRAVPIRTIIDVLNENVGRHLETKYDVSRGRPSDIPRAEGIFDKFRDRYGWVAKVPFEKTIKDVLTYEMARL